MIHCVRFNGGLGNQMFQYAFYLSLRKKVFAFLWLLDTKDSNNCHNGFELNKIFKISLSCYSKFFCFVYHRNPKLFKFFKVERQNDALKYYSLSQKCHYFPTIFEGYWQSEKYFSNVNKILRKHFTFREELLSKRTKGYASIIRMDSYSVSIHIRRGDYLQEPFRLVCDDFYYHKSIQYIKVNVSDPHFYVFSDDISYAKSLLSEYNCTFIDCNYGQESWQDMYLMSLCKHNIIANSSFSWWGAWLNNNTNKIVIAPKIWFRYNYNGDIVPNNWIRI